MFESLKDVPLAIRDFYYEDNGAVLLKPFGLMKNLDEILTELPKGYLVEEPQLESMVDQLNESFRQSFWHEYMSWYSTYTSMCAGSYPPHVIEAMAANEPQRGFMWTVDMVKKDFYRELRERSYKDTQDQLDMLYWDTIEGTTTFRDHVAAVKAAFPKPKGGDYA